MTDFAVTWPAHCPGTMLGSTYDMMLVCVQSWYLSRICYTDLKIPAKHAGCFPLVAFYHLSPWSPTFVLSVNLLLLVYLLPRLDNLIVVSNLIFIYGKLIRLDLTRIRFVAATCT